MRPRSIGTLLAVSAVLASASTNATHTGFIPAHSKRKGKTNLNYMSYAMQEKKKEKAEQKKQRRRERNLIQDNLMMSERALNKLNLVEHNL